MTDDSVDTMDMIDDFTGRVRKIDTEKVKSYLEGLSAPCYESVLMRIAFPDMPIMDQEPLTLYQNHFVLFHFLYGLQDEYRLQGKYLHVHFMNIFLFDQPLDGNCRYFEENLLCFCNAPCVQGRAYCRFHAEAIEDKAIDNLSIKYFYMDQRNYERLDAVTARQFINGAWELLTHYKEYQESYRILDLPQNADMETVRHRFRVLARRYHPDKGMEDHERFVKINNAYHLIIGIQNALKAPCP